jgi:hypothetical protein
MKIKIEPNRFQKLLEALMIAKSSKPMIDPVVLEFDETGVTSRGVYSTAMGVYARLEKSFFLEYESKKENVVVPSIFKDRLGWGFKEAEAEIHTKGDTLHADGKKDHFDTNTEALEPKKLPWEMILTDEGFLPDFNFEHEDNPKWKKGSGKVKVVSSFKLDAKELDFPSAKEYRFEYLDGELTVKVVDGGNYSSKVIGKAVDKKDIKFALDGEYLSSIVKNLDGEILWVFDRDISIFIEKKKDCKKTYFLATQIEE